MGWWVAGGRESICGPSTGKPLIIFCSFIRIMTEANREPDWTWALGTDKI